MTTTVIRLALLLFALGVLWNWTVQQIVSLCCQEREDEE